MSDIHGNSKTAFIKFYDCFQGALTHGDRRATESRDLSRFNFDNKVSIVVKFLDKTTTFDQIWKYSCLMMTNVFLK